MSKGKDREWGYASSDGEKLIYTSYENSGKVNKYHDNSDGGHGHEHWKDKDDYNKGKDSDWSRSKSNDSPNPSTGEVQDKGGCYLTTACMHSVNKVFNDNCYELTILRWFRDNFVNLEDINHYYSTSPIIVSFLDRNPDKVDIYKNTIAELENSILRPELNRRLVKSLKNIHAQ